MAFRFNYGETFSEALHRIGAEQFDRAIASLKRPPAVEAVHETRKCIKRLRALLRLVRSGIGDAAFDRENRRLRNVARDLAGERDRTVLLATIASLAVDHPQVKRVQRRLQADLLAPTKGSPAADARRLLRAATTALADARAQWMQLSLDPDTFEPLAEGLATGLHDLRASLDGAETSDDEAVHDWRKAAQRHWRHMRLMEAGWPSYFLGRADEAKAVSDLLGKAQDLTLLVRWVENLPEGRLDLQQARFVMGLARDQQTELRTQARLRCARLVAEGGNAHARRARLYWDSAGDLPAPAKPAIAAHRVEAATKKRSATPGKKRATAVGAAGKPTARGRAGRVKSVRAKGGRKPVRSRK